MQNSQVRSAVAAAKSIAVALGLNVDDAVVLQNSNKLALRLLPCDVFARVAPVGQEVAQFELEIARRLAETGSPVAALEPRVEPLVYVRDGFAVTLWTYYEPVLPRDIAPGDYAEALGRLHVGLREIDIAAPHFTDRVAEAQLLVDDRAHTPELGDADREFLSNALRSLRRTICDRSADEQLLHGEPHAGNVLRTKDGLLFIDLETFCRGPVEFDIAHCSRLETGSGGTSWSVDAETPGNVAGHYPDAEQALVRECWVLMLAMVAAWRWDRHDQFPDGRRMGIEFVSQLRSALDRYGINTIA